MMRKIVVGTRDSRLASIQTQRVIQMLKQTGIKNPFTIKKLATKGDKNLKTSIANAGGRGIFVHDIEKSLQEERIDFAVHSLKDMPEAPSSSLTIAAIPEREDSREAYISRYDISFKDLHSGAVVGTSSARRVAQIRSIRPDLQTKWIRGPVDVRLEQLKRGDFDALILAVAGLKRLGLDEVITEYLPPDTFIPAPGQGALAVECRENDIELQTMLKQIHDDSTAIAVKAERDFLNILDPQDKAPVGSYAVNNNGMITLKAFVSQADGKQPLYEVVQGHHAHTVAKEAAGKLIARGALKIIQAFYEGA